MQVSKQQADSDGVRETTQEANHFGFIVASGSASLNERVSNRLCDTMLPEVVLVAGTLTAHQVNTVAGDPLRQKISKSKIYALIIPTRTIVSRLFQ